MPAQAEAAIEFAHVHYRLAERELISDLNLQVRRGETLMLLGRSGSGKTTTLRLINRLVEPASGEILVQGTPTRQWDPIRLRRNIGYAIQDVGLFPHYTLAENIAVIPKLERWDPKRIAARLSEVLRLVGLPEAEFGNRYPHEISGGQKQRVGLARALAADPPILLMDEPFGALDPITRTDVQAEFKALQARLAKTVVFVTHDVGEALMLGTRIALMESGRLKGVYTPEEFLSAPTHEIARYLASFQALRESIRLPQDRAS